MPTWGGWEDQLLTAAGLPRVGSNRQYLDVWAQHANSNCARNPIDLSHTETGSSNCATLPGGKHAQRYASHARAARAFADQLNSGAYPKLKAGFLGGSLLTSNADAATVAELRKWGSAKFASFVSGTSGSPGGPPGAGSYVPHALKGWNDFRKQINTGLPSTLRKVDRLNRAARRHLARHH